MGGVKTQGPKPKKIRAFGADFTTIYWFFTLFTRFLLLFTAFSYYWRRRRKFLAFARHFWAILQFKIIISKGGSAAWAAEILKIFACGAGFWGGPASLCVQEVANTISAICVKTSVYCTDVPDFESALIWPLLDRLC